MRAGRGGEHRARCINLAACPLPRAVLLPPVLEPNLDLPRLEPEFSGQRVATVEVGEGTDLVLRLEGATLGIFGAGRKKP